MQPRPAPAAGGRPATARAAPQRRSFSSSRRSSRVSSSTTAESGGARRGPRGARGGTRPAGPAPPRAGAGRPAAADAPRRLRLGEAQALEGPAGPLPCGRDHGRGPRGPPSSRTPVHRCRMVTSSPRATGSRPLHSTRCVASLPGVFMAPQSRCKGCKWSVRECRGARARCYTRVVDWKAKDRGLWLTLAALTVLLVVLAALQYRWTSEIGRAEADRRQTQLERSTWRFGGAFDRETGPAADGLLPHGAAPSGRRPARAPAGAARGVAARRARRAPLRCPARDALALGRGHARGLWRGRRGLPRGPVDGGARAAAPEAPVDRGRERRVLRPAGVARRSPAGPGLPVRGRRLRRAARRAVGTLPRHRRGAACSWTRTT